MAKFLAGALTANRLIACIFINQLATPGLGSWMARRRIAGGGQLALAFSGFGLIMIWMGKSFYAAFANQLDMGEASSPPDWMWNWGWILFGSSWIWALVTSVALFFQARRLQKSIPIPPRITDPPPPQP